MIVGRKSYYIYKMANTLFQNALIKQRQNVPPIWFMRQAGRYHSHYQNLKEKYTFEQLCKSPELAAEVACGPVEEFDFDVSKVGCRYDFGGNAILRNLGRPKK